MEGGAEACKLHSSRALGQQRGGSVGGRTSARASPLPRQPACSPVPVAPPPATQSGWCPWPPPTSAQCVLCLRRFAQLAPLRSAPATGQGTPCTHKSHSAPLGTPSSTLVSRQTVPKSAEHVLHHTCAMPAAPVQALLPPRPPPPLPLRAGCGWCSPGW